MRMLESNHSRKFQTNRCHAALTPDYTPSPAKWLWPKRSEIRATLNTAASFSPAAVSRLRTPSPTKAGAMAWPMPFHAPVIAVPDHISPIPRKCLGDLAQPTHRAVGLAVTLIHTRSLR